MVGIPGRELMSPESWSSSPAANIVAPINIPDFPSALLCSSSGATRAQYSAEYSAVVSPHGSSSSYRIHKHNSGFN